LRESGREHLAMALRSARARTLELFDQLQPEQLALPYSTIVNLPLWEIGHLAWFQEYWCLRQADRPSDYSPVRESSLAGADRLFDSNKIAHPIRWSLALPDVRQTKAYLRNTLEASLEKLAILPETDEALYFHRLSLFHEYMHIEALTYTFQTLGYQLQGARPDLNLPRDQAQMRRFDSASVTLGSDPGSGFSFDNEKFSHRQNLSAFEIASQTVSVGEFAQFVESTGRSLPRHWRRSRAGLEQQRFGIWLPLPLGEAMLNVSAHEAEAYCEWAGKRLPTEAEWQYAAENWPEFCWGQQVWEWTASDFLPFPGFSADPYKEYSEPWFGDHRVVKGGSFATDPGMVSTKFRNFYQPQRDDPFIGFRVCSLHSADHMTETSVDINDLSRHAGR
jgi:gamma-glutamyl hercynylcysteine S-oxide synthase